MSAYTVATSRASRDRTWWAKWEMGSVSLFGYSDLRDATDEEAELMEKVVWNQDSQEDRERLRKLIERI